MKNSWRLLFTVLNCFAVTESFHGPIWCNREASFQLPHSLPASTSYYIETVNDSLETGLDTVKRLSEDALLHPGKSSCLRALEELRQLCQQRKPYNFLEDNHCAEGSLLEKVHQLIPTDTTKKVFEIVTKMQENGWLSTNPDSVDGLPSFHLNLVSSGTNVVDHKSLTTSDTLPSFEQYIEELTALVSPYIYRKLLPLIQQRLGTKDIRVSDIFLRRYGDGIIEGQSRHGISAHYDVFSRVTCVIAMDDTAKDGTNGLFTTLDKRHVDSSSSVGVTSNHRSLRRFFPLSCGDAVLHTWDVLHGVDVEQGVDRTSLIVWFDEVGNEKRDNESAIPWLTNRNDLETNHVAQFVLASGLESSDEDISSVQIHDSYIKSAMQRNVFAITRLGSVCENDELTADRRKEVKKLLEGLEGASSSLPEMFLSPELDAPLDLAKRLWWYGSTCGNPMAQVALADELMSTAMSQGCTDVESHIVLASVLFALAAQQGNDHAADSLHRIQHLEAMLREVDHSDHVDSLITRAIAVSALASFPPYA